VELNSFGQDWLQSDSARLNILRHAGDEEGSFQFCCEIANGGSFSAQSR